LIRARKPPPNPAAPFRPLAAVTTLVLDNIFGWIGIVDPEPWRA